MGLGPTAQGSRCSGLYPCLTKEQSEASWRSNLVPTGRLCSKGGCCLRKALPHPGVALLPTANSPPIWLCLVGIGSQRNPIVLAHPSGSCPLICRAETLGRAPHDPPLRGFGTMRSERKGSGEGDQETQSLCLLSLSHGSRGSHRNMGITVSVVALCLTS